MYWHKTVSSSCYNNNNNNDDASKKKRRNKYICGLRGAGRQADSEVLAGHELFYAKNKYVTKNNNK